MQSVKIKMKDGSVRDFVDTQAGRMGVSVKYEGGFVIAQDEWGQRHGFPSCDVAEVVETPTRRW